MRTMIDHRTLQIVFADLQDSIVALSSTNSPETIRRSAGVLAKVAQTLDIPFTVSVAPRPDGPGVIAELPETPPFVRGGPCCWDDRAWREAITAQARKTLAICGVTSEIVVLHTALAALADGYDVIVLVDASGGISERTENAALRQIEAAGGTVTSVASLVTSMVRDFTTPTGRTVITALHDLTG
ncbi:isochorismatase family protein [Streptosporangium sp. NBC_01756]|uniref:isochorismatase family protein n=1 Tax=Streptosporangium sp. NBC_01756 TaxID=2975950 RepID=UPI002DD7B5EC|nr:isochorismatase family protein [Streptosporangium sp. NBC_01756]WSC84991.1 isochorismatase family protein [Streptosporangium sp. NBC_01756]